MPDMPSRCRLADWSALSARLVDALTRHFKGVRPLDSFRRDQHLPPGGYAFTGIESMRTETRDMESTVAPTASRIRWLQAESLEPLVSQAVRAERPWTFAWLLRESSATLAQLNAVLRPFEAEALGSTGAYVRVRLPATRERLQSIGALPGVIGLGIVTAQSKVDKDFAAKALTSDPAQAPVFITLMLDDPDGRWRQELESLGVVWALGTRTPDPTRPILASAAWMPCWRRTSYSPWSP